jgi:membrane protease YdiL (CAAX protease family)
VNRRQLLTQVLTLWAVAFGAILAAFLLYPPAAKLISVAAFLYLPLWSMRRSGEDPADVGLTLSNWRADVLWAAGLFGVIAVGYFFAFQGWMAWGPAHGPGGPPPGLAFHPRFPRFWEHAIDQPFVVALPEEFFFRGWMQTRLKRVFPGGRQVFGVTVGPALLLTAALFALVHLTIFQPYRLAVFFPALLFGWLRERTGTVVGSTLLHAACNLYQTFLFASFSPLWAGRG